MAKQNIAKFTSTQLTSSIIQACQRVVLGMFGQVVHPLINDSLVFVVQVPLLKLRSIREDLDSIHAFLLEHLEIQACQANHMLR